MEPLRDAMQAEIDAGTLRHHHTSWTRGYVSRRNPQGHVAPYKGRFGEGYTVATPSWESTQYCYLAYWVRAR